jgi:hypothetical protein
MDTLIKAWKKLRGSPYSGDLAVGLLAFGLLRWGGVAGWFSLELSQSVPLALGIALLSASIDLMPQPDA